MQRDIKTFCADETGSVSVEYALIAVAVSISIVGALQLVAPQLNAIFAKVSTTMTSAAAK